MPSTESLPRFACPDWWEKIQAGVTPMAVVPLNERRAAKALAFFNRLRLPDVPGTPPMSEACGDWFRDILCAFLASEDPETKRRLVWELLCMVPKKNSKTTYVAALGLTALFMEDAPNRQMLLVAPSQNISERCFGQAQGMIRLDARLDAIFKVQDHLKCITRRKTGTKLDVKSFDTTIVTGEIPILTIIDELHELGKKSKAAAVMQQIRGGGITKQGGQVLFITTQSDQEPAGVWRTELKKARAIRDGVGGPAPILLPVLYEFPEELQRKKPYWSDPRHWPPILPNLGRSIDESRLIEDYENNGKVNQEAETIWVSQHLNIEIGVGFKSEGWAGAEYWEGAVDDKITSIDDLIARCEAIVIGLDGGGLDDLFGFAALGRETGTKRWLLWSHAWCHRKVLVRRNSIASILSDFAEAGDLTFIDAADDDILAIVDLIEKVNDAGLLAAVAIDNEGPYGELVDELDKIGVNEESEQIVGIGQGWRLMRAIKTTERKLENGSLRHAPSTMMNWCVRNVKIEEGRTAITATKQSAGDAKVDPVFGLWDAADVMIRNPVPKRPKSVYETEQRGFLVL